MYDPKDLMPHTNEEIQRQLRLGEDSVWEFKSVPFKGDRVLGSSQESLADTIAAFANGVGGTLLCGVTDQGKIEGMTRKYLDALERVLFEVCADQIKPSLNPVITRKELDGKAFLCVEIAPGNTVHSSLKGYLIRKGSSTRVMSNDEHLRLMQRRSQARYVWFDKQPVPNTGFGSLEPSLWKRLLSREGAEEPEIGLEKMGLLTTDDEETLRATVAGILLCANAPEEWLESACVTATCYRGADRATAQLDSQTITGPLDQQIYETLRFATRNMRVPARKDPARQDFPQYSEQALFEAIVNAVAHRDYSIQGSRIRLSMFQDRVEIQSPGALPNTLTPDSMGSRQSTRNEVIASAFGRLRVKEGMMNAADGRTFLMERRGDGVPIIKKMTWELSGKRPDFQLIDDTDVCVTLPAAVLPAAACEQNTQRSTVSVSCAGAPAPNVRLLAMFPNGTYKEACTDHNGEAALDLWTTHLPMVVYAAGEQMDAGLETNWLPESGALRMELNPLPEGGSIIYPERSGNCPACRAA